MSQEIINSILQQANPQEPVNIDDINQTIRSNSKRTRRNR
jgi:hypothetical protein